MPIRETRLGGEQRSRTRLAIAPPRDRKRKRGGREADKAAMASVPRERPVKERTDAGRQQSIVCEGGVISQGRVKGGGFA